MEKWIKILFTKKKLMKNKKLQFKFNEMFREPTKREVDKRVKDFLKK